MTVVKYGLSETQLGTFNLLHSIDCSKTVKHWSDIMKMRNYLEIEQLALLRYIVQMDKSKTMK